MGRLSNGSSLLILPKTERMVEIEIIFGIIAVVALMCSVLLAKEVVNLKEIIDSLREDVESLDQANIDISQKSQDRYLEQVQHITEMDNYLEEKLGKDASAIDEIFTATKGFDIRLKRVECRVGKIYSDFRKTDRKSTRLNSSH